MLIWGWKEISLLLGKVSVHTAMVWTKKYNLPVYKLGKKPFVEPDEIKEYLKKLSLPLGAGK